MPRYDLSVLVPETERLDRFLADQLDLSRTQAARLVAAGAVLVDGVAARASRTLVRGEQVAVVLEETTPPPRHLVPHARPLVFVYEDEHLAVLDKPAGLVVHPAPGHWDDTLVNALVARGMALSPGGMGAGTSRPGIVHRLDRDTSGLLVIAKSDVAHRRLAHAIAARRVHRVYAALVWGHLDAEPTIIDAPLGRHREDRKRMVVDARGRSARTEASTVARCEVADLLRVVLHTGRTHQIRVHLAHAGHPVVGDPVYHGGGSRRVTGPGRRAAAVLEPLTPRQALHAAELWFRHPITGEAVCCRSEWPEDLRPALAAALGQDHRIAGSAPLRYLRFFTDGGD